MRLLAELWRARGAQMFELSERFVPDKGGADLDIMDPGRTQNAGRDLTSAVAIVSTHLTVFFKS